MATTMKAVVESFSHLFEALHDRGFRKTINPASLSERELLRYMRFFLLGWFERGAFTAEESVEFPWTESGEGRIDFLVDGIAVEVAVRRKADSRSSLLAKVNAPEMVKLVKFRGMAMLVLFDFSSDPLDREALSVFRDLPSLGRGNHHKSTFHVYYFHKDLDSEEDGFPPPLHLRIDP